MLDDAPKNNRLTPGQHLRSEMKRRGIGQLEMANMIGVSRQIVNYIVNDKQQISRDVATALGRALDLPRDYFLQSDFDDVPADVQAKRAETLALNQSQMGVLVDHHIETMVAQKRIAITPFKPVQLRQASIDFTLGENILFMDGSTLRISQDAPYYLGPDETVNLETEEVIDLKGNCVARVGGTTEHARLGIAIVAGFQIDPSYAGKLQFCVRNFGARALKLVPGMTIVSVEFHAMSGVPQRGFDQKKHSQADTQIKFSADADVALLQRLILHVLEGRIEVEAANGKVAAHVPGLFGPTMRLPDEARARKWARNKLAHIVRDVHGEATSEVDADAVTALSDLVEDIEFDRAELLDLLDALDLEVDENSLIGLPSGRLVRVDIPGSADERLCLSGLLSALGLALR